MARDRVPILVDVVLGPGARSGQITLPGPVNPARLLALELAAGCLAGYRGAVKAIKG